MPQKRSNKGLLAGRVDEAISVGALAANDVIKSDWIDTPDDSRWMIQLKATWQAAGFTEGEGPLVVGVAHGDYTAAEIEEWLEVTGSWNSTDKIAGEQARRKIRQVGTFPLAVEGENLNDGKEMTTRLGFRLEAGEVLTTWAFNKSIGAITTGGNIKVVGKALMRRTA